MPFQLIPIRRNLCGEYLAIHRMIATISIMFLYERDSWTEFTWDASRILSLLGNARFAQGRLLGQVANLGFNSDLELELNATVQGVIASSRIEGVDLDARSVRSSVARHLGLAVTEKNVDTRSVEGAVSLMMNATLNYDEPLTFDRLAGWHNALFPNGYSGLRKITVAQYRQGGMQVVSGAIGHEKVHYQAPDAAFIPAFMDEFLSWVNESTEDNFLKAGIAHLWFLAIHPFDDGNGRIARAIIELFCCRSDGDSRRFYSMAEYILRHRSEYYNALESAQRGSSDITQWLEWFLLALRASIESSIHSVDDVLARDAWWHELGSTVLNERQLKILKCLLEDFEGKLTTGKWAKMCKVSSDTALRDITDLVDKGILVRDETAGGRSTSYRLKGWS